jgi:hypothetical protein
VVLSCSLRDWEEKSIRSIWAFLKLAFTPAKGAWNLIAAGGIGVAALWQWSESHPLLAGFLGLLGFSLLFAVGGARLQHRLDSLPRPKLVFGDSWTSRIPIVITEEIRRNGVVLGTQERHTGETVRAIGIGIANVPPERQEEATCDHAVVGLRFIQPGEGNTQPIRARGRWADNDYPRVRSGPGEIADELRRRTLYANGEVHRIQVAVLDGGTFYVASHDYWVGPPDMAERLPLDMPEYEVEIVVSGSRGQPVVARYRLRCTPDEDPPFTLEPISVAR